MSPLANGFARGYSYLAYIPLGVGNLKGDLVERQRELSALVVTTPTPVWYNGKVAISLPSLDECRERIFGPELRDCVYYCRSALSAQLPWRWLFPLFPETPVLFALKSLRGDHHNTCSVHTWWDRTRPDSRLPMYYVIWYRSADSCVHLIEYGPLCVICSYRAVN